MRRDRPLPGSQRILLALAMVALLFRVAVPPGAMVAQTSHGAALVICTGHGPMTAMAPMGKAPASKTRGDGGCEFAAHAANALVTSGLEPARLFAWTATVAPQPIVFEVAGCGLAAPPPPSHAPPVLST